MSEAYFICLNCNAISYYGNDYKEHDYVNNIKFKICESCGNVMDIIGNIDNYNKEE